MPQYYSSREQNWGSGLTCRTTRPGLKPGSSSCILQTSFWSLSRTSLNHTHTWAHTRTNKHTHKHTHHTKKHARKHTRAHTHAHTHTHTHTHTQQHIQYIDCGTMVVLFQRLFGRVSRWFLLGRLVARDNGCYRACVLEASRDPEGLPSDGEHDFEREM